MTSIETIKKAYKKGLLLHLEILITSKDDNKRQGYIKKRNSCFLNILQEYKDILSEDVNDEIKNYAGSALLFLNDHQDEYADSFYGIIFPAEKCRNLAGSENTVLPFHFNQTVNLSNQGLHKIGTSTRLSHAIRRSALEEIIKKLLLVRQTSLASSIDIDQKTLMLTLSQAYLMRGRIIRQKGFSIPIKKIEALSMAIEALSGYDTIESDQEYLRLRSLISLEQNKIKGIDVSDTERNITSYLEQLYEAKPNNSDYPFVMWHARKTGILTYLDRYSDSILKDGEPIEKLESSILLGFSSDDILGYAKETIEDLSKKPFSSDAWEEMIDLLKSYPSKLKPIIMDVWKAARRQESLNTDGCHLRWYWSRQQDIYEMAFHATDESSIKAEIADSLKGRPVLQRHIVEEMARNHQDVSLKEYIENENAALSGQYITKFKTASAVRLRKKLSTNSMNHDTPEYPKFEETPKPWIAVHFFISTEAYILNPGCSNSNKFIYAMIHDSVIDEWKTQGPFDLEPIWLLYMRWQEFYHRMGSTANDGLAKQQSAPYMKKLCECIGKTLFFIFDFPRDRPVVFIPHGFLHLIPIHMAINDTIDDEYNIWAYKRKFTYLPSWSLSGINQKSADLCSLYNVKVLKYFFEYEYPRLFASLKKEEVVNNKVEKIDPACATHVLNLPTDTSHLVLLCHGTADPMNPFNSGLKLGVGDRRLTVREILSAMPQLTGLSVLLGSCETDMVGATVSPLDEYLSVSSSFLEKGAAEIIGGLYELYVKGIESIALSLINIKNINKPLVEVFSLYLEEQIENYCSYTSPKDTDFYRIAAFRPLGLRIPINDSYGKNCVPKA